MTKRASLSPKERKAMWDKQRGRCAVCEAHTSLSRMIAEHIWPVAQGNTAKPDALLCRPCAHRKTYGTKATTYGSDAHETAKMKRIANGGRKRKGRQIQSRGFQKPPEGYTQNWPKRKVGA